MILSMHFTLGVLLLLPFAGSQNVTYRKTFSVSKVSRMGDKVSMEQGDRVSLEQGDRVSLEQGDRVSLEQEDIAREEEEEKETANVMSNIKNEDHTVRKLAKLRLTYLENDTKMADGANSTKIADEASPTKMADGANSTKMAAGANPTKMADGANPTKMSHGPNPTKMMDGASPTKMADGPNLTKMADGASPTKMADGASPTKMAYGASPEVEETEMSSSGTDLVMSKVNKPVTDKEMDNAIVANRKILLTELDKRQYFVNALLGFGVRLKCVKRQRHRFSALFNV